MGAGVQRQGDARAVSEPRALSIVEAEFREVDDQRHALYWRFTRCANAPPVPAAVTRRWYALEVELREARRRALGSRTLG